MKIPSLACVLPLLLTVVGSGCAKSSSPSDAPSAVAPSRCDPEPASDFSTAETGCADLDGGPDGQLAPKLSVTSQRPFQNEICLDAVFAGDSRADLGPFDVTELKICIGVVNLGPKQSFTAAPASVGPNDALAAGTAFVQWTRERGTCGPPTGHSPALDCPATSTITLRMATGTVECERDDWGDVCRIHGQTFADSEGHTLTGSAWVHAKAPPEPVPCDPPPEACGDDASGAPNASCITSTGDVLRKVVATSDDGTTGGAPYDGQTCFFGHYEPKCDLGDNQNVNESDNFGICLGVKTPPTVSRVFTVSGMGTQAGVPPPDGQASLTRGESILTTTPSGSTIQSGNWIATSGSVTCGPQNGFLSCHFDGVVFTDFDTKKTSTASGWLHTPLP
jgi:hypothetical protein